MKTKFIQQEIIMKEKPSKIKNYLNKLKNLVALIKTIVKILIKQLYMDINYLNQIKEIIKI